MPRFCPVGQQDTCSPLAFIGTIAKAVEALTNFIEAEQADKVMVRIRTPQCDPRCLLGACRYLWAAQQLEGSCNQQWHSLLQPTRKHSPIGVSFMVRDVACVQPEVLTGFNHKVPKVVLGSLDFTNFAVKCGQTLSFRGLLLVSGVYAIQRRPSQSTGHHFLGGSLGHGPRLCGRLRRDWGGRVLPAVDILKRVGACNLLDHKDAKARQLAREIIVSAVSTGHTRSVGEGRPKAPHRMPAMTT